ncbi:CO(2)-response secreted protease [Juglans microcarpa x Juglans regia]|uniref:CO(2)-response secreted protease n=1 Tax=Juglans microcarpa x Juglans regia TaxID=2249226 RepID=UPI001B7F0C5A|nr:CO(2)-response secreted protease [Juglans microcarpa x Juglans regia]
MMKGNYLQFFSFWSVFLVLFLDETRAAEAGNDFGVYIVYMGAADIANGSLRDDHVQLMNRVLRRRENALVHTYKHGFSGFAARISEEEARSIAQKPGVVSVFPDPLLQLHTTRSWDFLKYQTSVVIDSTPNSESETSSLDQSDSIIGILDTGIWPESESFSDKDIVGNSLPSGWKGTCMTADDFSSSNCNKKLIGARFYNATGSDSPRDTLGHGTHVASTAAGTTIASASYYGLAAGTAKGGSSGSRIAVYSVCSLFGCRGSTILSAFDDAINDGVDVLSLSLGTSSISRLDLQSDPIAIGAFHAVEHGIIVVCSAGNDGPDAESVVNIAPWILTVAASTIDRDFQSNLVLGGNKVIKGEGINFSPLQKSPVYPLIYAKNAKKSGAKEVEASNCEPGSLDKDLIKGKIVVCNNDDEDSGYSKDDKLYAVKDLGAIGIALMDDKTTSVANPYGDFPATIITSKDAEVVLSYINSTRDPVATILPTVSVTKYTPAPNVAYFSARGPSYHTRNILKPDVSAPGVDILASWIGNDTSGAPKGKEASLFNILSGTSMACPHVSGIVATVKSQNRTWSPSAIKSAIMTTATQTNNLKAPITTDSGAMATPYDYGAGEVTTSGPLRPGLVYETTTIDYLNYLCYSGLDISAIRTIAQTIPDGFACPKDSRADYISNINYPSIAVSNFNGKESKNVSRTVTNVAGDGETVYTVSVDAPSGVNVSVVPEKLQFTKNELKLSYQVIFSSSGTPLKEDHVFGSITWTNGNYKVRSPFVISNNPMSKAVASSWLGFVL